MTESVEKAAEELAIEHYPCNDSVFQPPVLISAKQGSFKEGFLAGDFHGFKRAMESTEVKGLVEALERAETALARHDASWSRIRAGDCHRAIAAFKTKGRT